MQNTKKQTQTFPFNISTAPKRLVKFLTTLKTSPQAQQLRELDARAGQMFSRMNAAIWFAMCLPILAFGYISWLSTDGFAETILLGIAAVFLAWCAGRGVRRLMWPKTASEVLADVLEDRVRPARLLLRAFNALVGRGNTPAG